jgi:hypothetical protein
LGRHDETRRMRARPLRRWVTLLFTAVTIKFGGIEFIFSNVSSFRVAKKTTVGESGMAMCPSGCAIPFVMMYGRSDVSIGRVAPPMNVWGRPRDIKIVA